MQELNVPSSYDPVFLPVICYTGVGVEPEPVGSVRFA